MPSSIEPVASARPAPATPPALEDRLRLLEAVTDPEGGSFDDRVRRALALTTTLLGFEVGILSRIQDEAYTVVACYAPDAPLAPGDRFALGDTYCSMMLSEGQLLSIEHMARSPWRRHPCYAAFQLESYAGVPVYRKGVVWGTLNVSSSQPAEAPLADADADLLRVLASWIGSELERESLIESRDRYEARLRAILSRAPLILYAFDTSGTITLSIGGGLEAIGLETDEAIGMNVADFYEPGSAADICMRGALQGTAGTWQAEHLGTRFETSVEPIRDDANQVVGGIAVSTDITERARAQDALRESEGRYRTLSAATTEGIAFSRDGVILDSNQQLAVLFGYEDPAEMVGMQAADMVASEFHAIVQTMTRENRTEPYEAVCLRRDGSRFWAQVNGQPIRYGGETVRMTAIRDITSQKGAEAQTRFQADVLRHVSDAVVALDLEGRVTYWNAGAERIHGFTADEMIGRRLDEVVRYRINEARHAAPTPESELEAMFRDADSFGHLVYTSPVGVRRYVSVSSSVLRDEAGDARGMLAVVRDVTEQHEMAVQLHHQAYHDVLTGLPNRAWFRVQVEAALDKALPFAVLFLDLDHFKVVNDSLGHDAGDQLLKVIAMRLRETLGATEGAVVSRLGGDEFGVLLPGPPEHASRTATALLRALDAPLNLGPRTISPAGSVGVVAAGSQYDELDALLRDADTAMYVAKRSGRNQICVFDEAMHEAAKARFQLEHDLRLAIDRDEFRLRFQPIVDLSSGHVAGFEALVRWEHPRRGLLGPGVFIPLAEEINLIPDIDRWVLRATCQEIRDWDRGEAAFLMSVNCSDQTLLSDGFETFAGAAAREAGLPPGVVALELTERALIDATESTDTLTALRADGFKILVDDFGSGYSSLGLLHTLPIDGLKIDQSFVADLETSPSARAVVRAVAQMAADLGLRAVAEGIETREQLERLQALGSPLGQGYLFARPVPPDEARALLGQRLTP